MIYKNNAHQKLVNFNNLCQIYYVLKSYNFFIFLELFLFTNKNLLDIKITLKKLENKSLVLNSKYITKLFDSKICQFLGTKTLLVCISS